MVWDGRKKGGKRRKEGRETERQRDTERHGDRECIPVCSISKGLNLCLPVPTLVHILFVYFFPLCLHAPFGFEYVIFVCVSGHISLVCLHLYYACLGISVCVLFICRNVSSCVSLNIHVFLSLSCRDKSLETVWDAESWGVCLLWPFLVGQVS